MPTKKLNGTQEQVVIKLYNKGLTIDKVAEIFNISDSAIGYALKKNNIEIRNNSSYGHWELLSPEQEKEIIKQYQENIPSTKIAENFGINKGRVIRILRRENIEIKSPGSYFKLLNEAQEKQILKLYSKGLSISEIGRRYEVDQGVINKILVNHNIEKRDPGIYHRKFTKAQEQEIIDLYINKKLSVNKIAGKFKVEFRTISKIMKDNNIKVLTSKDMKKLTPEQEQEMINLYWRSGYSTHQLAEKYNISRTSVKRIFVRNDVQITDIRQTKASSIKRKINESQYPKIISLYKGGLTQAEVSKLYDVGEETIRKILRKNNVAARKNYSQKITPKQAKEIVKLYKQDISTIKLAKQFNVDKSTIQRVLEKNKIEVKGPGYFNKKLTAAQEKEILGLYREGLSISKVSQRTNIDNSTIKLVLKRNDIEVRPGSGYQVKVNEEVEQKIIELFRQGNTVKKIAETLALSPQTVSITLKRNNIEITLTYQHLRKVTEETEKEIARLYREGLNMKEIAVIVRLDPRTVSKVLNRLNLIEEKN
jgi:transposase